MRIQKISGGGCLFQIEKFETETRTFAGEILTDGGEC